MRSIISLGLTALAATASSVSAETTVAILEFGPGGSVHRTTSSFTESNSAAVSSLWNVLHRPSSKRSSSQHSGMSVVPDLFTRADAGIVVGLQGESLKSMPTAMSLLDAGATVDNVVGHVHVPGQAGAELMKRASSNDLEMISKEDIGRRLQLTAETAARGAEGIDALSLAVDNDDAAAVADEQLGRMLKTLKEQATANGKTVVLHLVVDSNPHRRLEENNQDQDGDGENQNNNNAYSNEKTMYEIQTFNLFLWTAVGLFVLLSMVISAFIDMPLMPDTLLFAETAKMGSD